MKFYVFLVYTIFIFGSLLTPLQILAKNPHQTNINHLPSTHPVFQSLKNHKDRLYFIDRGRSGTHWLIYILQHFTKRPCFSNQEYSDFFYLDLDFSKPPILHSHEYQNFVRKDRYFHPLDKNSDFLITIVRDPKECLTRGKSIETIYKILNFPDLYEFLEFYDGWPKERRFLVYYEDLITDPKTEITKLLNFLNLDCDRANQFVEDLAFHKKRSLEYYINYHERSFTYGDQTVYHALNLPQEVLNDITDTIERRYPYLWKKYLLRYKNTE